MEPNIYFLVNLTNLMIIPNHPLSMKAWRNQARAPVNARSCKHLRQLLGDAYEDARLKHMNPDGVTPGPSKTSKASSKSTKKGSTTATRSSRSSTNKRKKQGDDEGEEDQDDDSNGSKKKLRSSGDTSKPTSKNDQSREQDEDEGEVEGEVNDGKAAVNVLLAVKWDLEKGADPTGWWVSEKLDGVR